MGAVQLGIGGPVERSFGLPRCRNGPLPSAFAIGIEITVVDNVAIKTPTITIMVSIASAPDLHLFVPNNIRNRLINRLVEKFIHSLHLLANFLYFY